ncbi:maleylacetoacetate isomerase [Parasphingorhabdus sp.]|jgi:maleylacetoacetate isomerase|uniref:maleylacetoacetate isomerase n=1 Tax=Parasphingorhabdus sp. TaxID=2709688 RepID=UPI003D2E3D32
MTDIILHDYWRSSASYRVRIVLNLKQVPHELHSVNLLDGDHKGAAYKAINPQGRVPSLTVDGHDIIQSLAIIDYLDATYPDPPMVSSNPLERARILGQALIIATDIHPINNMAVGNYLKSEFGADGKGVVKWMQHWIQTGFAALEELAPDAGFFGGDAPNLADVCLVPQIYNARRFETDLSAFPKLVRIDAACNQLKAFQEATPESVKENP